MLVTETRPTLCDPMDYHPPGSTVHGIFQARILEWVVIPSSRGSSPPRDQAWVSCIAGRFFFFFFNHLSHQGSHPPTPSQMELLLKAVQEGTSPVVQWLRLHAPKAGGLSSIPDQGTRFHMLQPKIPYAVTEIDQRCRVPQLSLGAAK